MSEKELLFFNLDYELNIYLNSGQDRIVIDKNTKKVHTAFLIGNNYEVKEFNNLPKIIEYIHNKLTSNQLTIIERLIFEEYI